MQFIFLLLSMCYIYISSLFCCIMEYYVHTSWTSIQECEEFRPFDPWWRPETGEINSRIYFPFQASNEEPREKKRWSEGGLWRTEDCAEAAELQSGLVAAVIILMLVVKQLWQGGKASMADPLPSTALDAKLQGNTCWLVHHHHQHQM